MGTDGSGGNLSLLITVFIILIIAGGYFSGSESAISAMNKLKIKGKAEDGDNKAKKAMAVVNNFSRAITTLLIGNNITHIAAGSVATLIAVRLFGNSATVGTVSTLVATATVFLFSEMIPKALANDRADSISLATSGFLLFLMKIFKPISSVFMKISGFFTKLFHHSETPSFTEDELYDIIDTAEEEGVVDEEQSDLIKNALDFSDREVGKVMTMKDDITSLSISSSNDEIVKVLTNTSHSRIPVYGSTFDDIKGILNIRTFFREYKKDKNVDISSLLISADEYPETTLIDDLLTLMQEKKQYIALVTDREEKDDLGRPVIVGLVTIEDLLEELVGEIWDEDDSVDENYIKLGGNYFRVNPDLLVGNAFGRFGYVCKNRDDARKTVRNLISENLDEIDEESSFIYRGRVSVSVEEVSDDGSVKSAVLHPLDDDEIEQMLEEAEKAEEENV